MHLKIDLLNESVSHWNFKEKNQNLEQFRGIATLTKLP